MESRPPKPCGAGIELRAKLRGGGRKLGQAMEERSEVQHGATHQERDLLPGVDRTDAGEGILYEAPGGVALGRLADVDEVMRDALPQLARGLCGPDVEAAVDLRGVDADDLDGRPLGEPCCRFSS